MDKNKDIEDLLDRELKQKVDSRRFKEKDKEILETVEEVLDHFTMEILYDLIRELRIKKILGAISSGKEARVFPALSASGEYYALKIYLTFTREFKKSVWKYILGDPRFEGEKVTSTKSLIYLWCKKEYKNLVKMSEAGVSVPKPIAHKGNVLVMRFVGENGFPAPLLKNYYEELEDPEGFYMDVVNNMRLITCKAKLVHGDLSEYNIMVWRNRPVIIDVSQAVHVSHPNALIFLSSDVRNINRFFKEEVGIDVISSEELVGELKQCMGT